jgi:hypothetical protein
MSSVTFTFGLFGIYTVDGLSQDLILFLFNKLI